MKILIVDDLSFVRQVLRIFLEDLGHTVIEEMDGGVGGVTCLRERPDLTITDMDMVSVDGDQMIETVRSMWPEARFIAMSGLPAGRRLPADVPMLEKPLNFTRLMELLK
jgi:CheY-like chemotaxis protein